jgi:hypothetical protein
MESRKSDQKGDLSYDVDAKPFRMLSLFDSEQAGTEAEVTTELVLRELGTGIEADRSIWHIQSLDSIATRSRVAEEAARADVIVLALADDKPSRILKQWVAEWQKNRELNGGLIALIPSGDSETGGDLADFLYETAVTARMDFLCQRKRRG